jgi:hypothetical protein
MTAHEVLTRARARLIEGGPAGWCQESGWRRVRDDGGWHEQFCALGRLCEMSSADSDVFYSEVLPARKAALAVLTSIVGMPLPRWNDTPGRTYDDVVALYDRAVLEAASPAAVPRRYVTG